MTEKKALGFIFSLVLTTAGKQNFTQSSII